MASVPIKKQFVRLDVALKLKPHDSIPAACVENPYHHKSPYIPNNNKEENKAAEDEHNKPFINPFKPNNSESSPATGDTIQLTPFQGDALPPILFPSQSEVFLPVEHSENIRMLTEYLKFSGGQLLMSTSFEKTS
jgi:hypothetical protein